MAPTPPIEPKDPRVTSTVAWLTNVAQAVTVAIVLAIFSVVLNLRDGQIKQESRLEALISNDRKQDEVYQNLDDAMESLTHRLTALEVKQRAGDLIRLGVR